MKHDKRNIIPSRNTGAFCKPVQINFEVLSQCLDQIQGCEISMFPGYPRRMKTSLISELITIWLIFCQPHKR